MILYLDTSALVKLYVEEAGTREMVARVERATAVATVRITYGTRPRTARAPCAFFGDSGRRGRDVPHARSFDAARQAPAPPGVPGPAGEE